MRRPTGPASLRLKVILLVLSVCTVALAVAIATFVAYQYRDLRARTVLRVAALAQVTADNCSSALAFRDARTAAETLEALAVDQRIVGAAIYSRRGELFASFERPGAQVRFQAPVPGQPDTFSAGRVTVARPIRFERRALGTIVLIGDLAVLEKQVADLVRLGLAVLLAALLLAAMLASRLQRMVTAPVLRLAAAAEQVAERQDFSLRVAPGPADEIGLLTENFNRMLARIERSDQELRESEQRFAVAVAGARDGIWEWRLDLGNAYYSPRWKEMLGHADSELSDRPSEWTERIHPDELPRVHALLAEHLDGKSPRFEAEFRMRHRDGRWIWVLARAVAQRDAAGKVTRLAGSLTDVTDRRGRDVLTGLWNRSKFTEYIESALERTRSASGRGFAVLFVELEQLRAISDAHGRAAGRDLLIAAAVRIQGAIDYRDAVARLEVGGFAVLLEEVSDPEAATRTARRIQEVLALPFHLAGQELFTTAAIGIATSVTGHERPEDLLSDAEAALDRAQVQGRNHVEVFDESMRARALARLALEGELRNALARGALDLHFQPILRVGGRRLAGLEALARWRRENGEPVAPADFIALAEETGIIVPLGSWVLRRALEQLREWREAAGDRTDLMVSVNVSGRQLARVDLVDEVKAALADTGIPPGLLKLEITETVLVDDLAPIGEVLRNLRRIGVGLWLDDFGTGYSSLSYLNRFRFEALKIDRSFVASIDEEPERQATVRAIVALARGLGMKSVAEGVETDAQLRRLSALRCDYAQGHLISLPLGHQAVTQLLHRFAVPTTPR